MRPTLSIEWRTLDGHIDEQRYREVLERLEFQAGHAQVWRDSICRWFMKRSGIADEKGRVGNYPNRVEAEDQQLDGYQVTKIEPWEAASGRGAAQLPGDVATGSVRFQYRRPAGTIRSARPILRRGRRRVEVQAVRGRPSDRPMAGRQSRADADDIAGCPFVDPPHGSRHCAAAGR